jgi:hypothetical protein
MTYKDFLFISKGKYNKPKFIRISEMKNKPTLQKMLGQKIIMIKLQELLIQIGLNLRTPKFIISLIILELKKICEIVNMIIFMDKEQVDKDCGFRSLRTKAFVRDDLLEVTTSVWGIAKSRSERKVAELNLDLTEVLKPVLGGEKTRSDFDEKNLKLENNFENSFNNEKISDKNFEFEK